MLPYLCIYDMYILIIYAYICIVFFVTLHYLCIYIYIHMCMGYKKYNRYTHICRYIYTYVFIYIYTHICIIYIYIYMHVCTHILVNIYSLGMCIVTRLYEVKHHFGESPPNFGRRWLRRGKQIRLVWQWV